MKARLIRRRETMTDLLGPELMLGTNNPRSSHI
jgi:hypothetical protein